MSACKLADTFAVLRRFDILIWHKVVQHKRNLIPVKHALRFHFIHLMNSHRRSDIVSENEIQLCLDQLSRADRGKPCMRCKNLLCHRHTHVSFPPDLILQLPPPKLI